MLVDFLLHSQLAAGFAILQLAFDSLNAFVEFLLHFLLDLEQTAVTAAGVAKLKQQLPQCQISHSPRDRPTNERLKEPGEAFDEEADPAAGEAAQVDPAVETRKAFKESLLGSQWRIGQLSITLNEDGSTSGKWDKFNESRWEITDERSFAIIHTRDASMAPAIAISEHPVIITIQLPLEGGERRAPYTWS